MKRINETQLIKLITRTIKEQITADTTPSRGGPYNPEGGEVMWTGEEKSQLMSQMDDIHLKIGDIHKSMTTPSKPWLKESQKRINEQTGGVVTHAMIQNCKHLLNNIPGGSATWKQNMKQTALGKPCNWVRNRMSFFHSKANTATSGSGAWSRFRAKAAFLECLLGQQGLCY